jgi:hypothetical protein
MNDQLAKLYLQKWTGYYQAFEANAVIQKLPLPAMPLLLGVKNEVDYQNSDLRIMILGQETNGWDKFCPDIQVRKLQDWNIDKTVSIRGKGPFTSGRLKLIRYFNKYFPQLRISFLWNNVVKIGKDNEVGFAGERLYQIEKQHFSVLKDEIDILKPNILFFLSGYLYDRIIFDKLGKLETRPIPNFALNHLCELSVPNVTCAIRTCHPNYLYRNGIDRYYHAIIERVKVRLDKSEL